MPRIRAPRVIDNELKDSGYPAAIVVGTPFWFEWLESHESFNFENTDGKFTAVKTRGYWTAHRRVKGKLYRHYLGASQDLKLNKLCEAAKDITTSVFSLAQSRKPEHQSSYETDCETTKSSLLNSEEKVKQLAKERDELDQRVNELEEKTGELGLALQLKDEEIANLHQQLDKAIASQPLHSEVGNKLTQQRLNPGNILNQLRQRDKKSKASIKDIEAILDLIEVAAGE